MRTLVGLSLLVTSVAVASLAGCSTGTDGSASSSENATVDPDLALAQKAVAIIQGDSGHCTSCHTAAKSDIKTWGAAFTKIESTCLDPSLTKSALDRVNCLRKDPTTATSAFQPSKLGLWAAGAALSDFSTLFQQAYSATAWQAQYATFKTKAGMPANNHTGGLSEAEWGVVKAWALKGLVHIDDVITDPVGTADCAFDAQPELTQHMADMKVNGWGAKLAAASTSMALCGTATDPTKCLTALPDLSDQWGNPGSGGNLRQLRALTFNSSFWVRSSPDGRFTSFGGSPSRIIDNTNPNLEIDVSSPYDPGYFPNNDGFSFAGTGTGGISACKMSVLLAAAQPSASHKITFSEAGCTNIVDDVYQSVGASLDGSLYFMSTGTHTNDSGDSDGPLNSDFGDTASTTLTPMFNNGNKYVAGTAATVQNPNEGDQQLSPSNQLLITRFGDGTDAHAGYHFRQVTTTVNGQNVSVSTKVVGTACVAGGKPQVSFDERFLAVHSYVDANANPQNLPADSSNIFVVDMKTGKKVQVTKMLKGQHALYPHWRADGWLYFLVRDGNNNKETLVASDIALHADAQ